MAGMSPVTTKTRIPAKMCEADSDPGNLLLEHILKKNALLKSLCRPSVRLSVSYFSAAIAPRELKF
jgi:hypothetical protein